MTWMMVNDQMHSADVRISGQDNNQTVQLSTHKSYVSLHAFNLIFALAQCLELTPGRMDVVQKYADTV